MGNRRRSKQTQTAGSPAQSFPDEQEALTARVTQSAKEKASGLVETQKDAAADQVEDVARVLDDVAKDAPIGAPYLRQAASSMHRMSSSLRERGANELLQEFGRFLGRRPGTLIGASLIGGFALARFLKSSAERSPAGRRNASGMRPRPSRDPSAAPRSDMSSQSDASAEAASLSELASPVAGMGSISEATAGPTGKTGTSSAGGASDAPDQGAV